MFTIGEIAKLVNISANTLRYYDEISLLQPAEKDDQNGYRLYSEEQIKEILFIQELKYFGFSLNEIKKALRSNKSELYIALKNKLQIQKQKLSDDEMRIKIIMKKIEELNLIMDKKELILIVEGVSFERMLMKEILLTNGYKNLIEAENGQQALEVYEKYRPYLIITAITMPVMDGLYFMGKIIKIQPDIKFIYCTSMSQLYILQESIKLGCIDFISKPLVTERLISSVIKAFEMPITKNSIKLEVLQKLNDVTKDYYEKHSEDSESLKNFRLSQKNIDVFIDFCSNNTINYKDFNKYLIELFEEYRSVIDMSGNSTADVKIDFERVDWNIKLQKEINNKIIEQMKPIYEFVSVTTDFVWLETIEMYITNNDVNRTIVIEDGNQQVGGICFQQDIILDIDSLCKTLLKNEKELLGKDVQLSVVKDTNYTSKINEGYILSTFLDSNNNVFCLFLRNQYIIDCNMAKEYKNSDKLVINMKNENIISKSEKSTIRNKEIFMDGFEFRLQGITFDDMGNMYVCMDNHDNLEIQIIKITHDKKTSVFAVLNGEGPTGLSFKGNDLYLAAREKVYIINQQGEINIIADGFTTASDINFDESGNMYVCDSIVNKVYKVSTSFEKTVFIEDNTSFDTPVMAFDSDYKYLYLLDAGVKFDGTKVMDVGGRLLRYKMNTDNTLGEQEVIVKNLRKPLGIAIDKNGIIYISLTEDSSVLTVLDNNETFITKSCDELNGIQRMAFGKDKFGSDNIYISSWSGKIIKVNTSDFVL